ncbi:MAG TPA: DUF2155 domain-containing protein [Stellaceae bacterium]|nr:DUF2155 domain-containing protein [Stellaceae bacterium]
MIKPLPFFAAALLVALPALAQKPPRPAPQPQGPKIAVLQGLDKTTARVTRFEAPIGETVTFGTLRVTVRACNKAPPEEPPNTNAFLEIDETHPQEPGAEPLRLFSGWMFASSPALSAMEDPIYDVTLLDCTTATGSSSKPAGK